MFTKNNSAISCLRIIYVSLLLFISVPFSYQSTNYRLPNDSIPLNYEIKLNPHMTTEDSNFEGESKILLQVLKATKKLTLNSFNIEFYEESTKLVGERVIFPYKHILEEEPQFLILNFQYYIEPGYYTLHLKYRGKLNNPPFGMFKDDYYERNGELRILVATQFETTYARQAFPCWDEPAIKATFEISIKHFPNYTALSNMPLKETIHDTEIDGKVWSKFEKTPSMSTYLVSFTVSDFERMTNSFGNFSVWTHKETLKYLNHSYEIGVKTLPIMEEYTGIPYHLPKLDVIGLPGFPIGGMENWGLITMDEHRLLSDNHTSREKKFETSSIMVHEIAHQWFGNLVSPAWWKDAWITEGLATYMHYFILGKVINLPRIMDYFVVDNNFDVMIEEAFGYGFKMPVYRDVNNPRETMDHLSRVHYKAATVMHMISGLITEEVFHSGIKIMLQKYKYKTITTNDFWSAMQEAMRNSKLPNNNFDIKEKIEPYVSRAGYPIINVSRDYRTGIIKLKQLKYSNCTTIYCHRRNRRFWVPINFATSSSLNFSSSVATDWMDPDKEEFIINGVNPLDWFIININSVGFNRINYDETNWNRISEYLNSPNFINIPVLNRAKILDDAYFLTTDGKMKLSFLRNLTSYLSRETDYIPWMTANVILEHFWASELGTREKREFIMGLVQPLIYHTGTRNMPEDDFFTKQKRFIGLSWSCKVLNRYCKILVP